MPEVSPLVSTQWLAAHLDDPNVVVVDASWYLPTANRKPYEEYLAGHIPGAVFFDIDGVADKSTGLPHMLLPPEEFGRQAGAYRRQLGFEPTAVRVPACEERGDEATAHVVLTGRGKDRHEYKDAVMLRRRDGRWLVVLPAEFGRR